MSAARDATPNPIHRPAERSDDGDPVAVGAFLADARVRERRTLVRLAGEPSSLRLVSLPEG